MQKILIGTSGYDYPEWKGVFYPPELSRKEFLSYYVTQFNALELNNTFYSMPTSQRMKSFIERAEEKLFFSVKANKVLTHEISRSWKDDASTFKQAIFPILEKSLLSSILFQFPQMFHYTTENRVFLFKILQEFSDFPVVVEFRHREWIKESVFEGLEKLNVSPVFCDMPNLKYLPQVEFNNSLYAKMYGPQVYLRLHGKNATNWYAKEENSSIRYDYDYSKTELLEFVPIIHMIKNAGKFAQVFFNNHPKGSSALNGKLLQEMIITSTCE